MIAPTSTNTSRSRNTNPSLKGQWLSRGLAVLSIALFACSCLGHFLGRFYFLELFSHFKIQYQWVAYGLIALWIICWLVDRTIATGTLPGLSVILLLATVYVNQTVWIPGDYDLPIPAPGGDVRVLHANVLYSREEYATTVAMLKKHQSDLYVLQEMTPTTIRLVTAQLRAKFPYWFACPSKQQVWTLVGSRTAFRVDQALARRHHIITLETTIRGHRISLLTVHPHTPVIPSWFTERNEQLAYAAHKARHNALPTVLIGDFNISPFSPSYEELFQPAMLTAINKSTDKQWPLTAARQTKTQPTWPRFFPAMMIPIDHAFVNKGFTTQSFRTLDQPGSDHRALVVDLNLR